MTPTPDEAIELMKELSAAKKDTLTELAVVLRDALGEQWHRCRTVADAIDAHIQAILKDAKQ